MNNRIKLFKMEWPEEIVQKILSFLTLEQLGLLIDDPYFYFLCGYNIFWSTVISSNFPKTIPEKTIHNMIVTTRISTNGSTLLDRLTHAAIRYSTRVGDIDDLSELLKFDKCNNHENFTKCIMSNALKYGHPEIVQWVLDDSCDCNCGAVSLLYYPGFNFKYAKLAAKYDHTDITLDLLDKTCCNGPFPGALYFEVLCEAMNYDQYLTIDEIIEYGLTELNDALKPLEKILKASIVTSSTKGNNSMLQYVLKKLSLSEENLIRGVIYSYKNGYMKQCEYLSTKIQSCVCTVDTLSAIMSSTKLDTSGIVKLLLET